MMTELSNTLITFMNEESDSMFVNPKNFHIGDELAARGLRIAYFRNRNPAAYFWNKKLDKVVRDWTVVFKEVRPGIIEFSSAACNPKDQFNKNLGAQLAILNWDSGLIAELPQVTDDPYHSVQRAFQVWP